MADAPKPLKLDMTDYPGVPSWVKQLFDQMNPWLDSVTNAVDGNLSLTANGNAKVRSINITIPLIPWTPLVLTSPWTTYGGGSFGSPAYRVDATGRVFLRGAVAGGTVAFPSRIALLPSALAPLSTMFAPQYGFDTVDGIYNIRVAGTGDPNGNVPGDIRIYSKMTGAYGATAAAISLHNMSWDSTSPPAPAAFVGVGWPILLQACLSTPPTACLLVKSVDITPSTFAGGVATVKSSFIPGQPAWTTDAKNNIVINRLDGLTPGRTYKLSFLVIGS